MLPQFLRPPQKAIPSIQECIPGLLLYIFGLLSGCAGIFFGGRYSPSSAVSEWAHWGGFALCTVVAGCLPASLKIWKKIIELNRKGIITQGQVVALWKETPSSANFSLRVPAHYVLYSFEVKALHLEPREYLVTQVLSVDVYRQLRLNMPLRIRFLPHDPNLSRVES